MAKPTKRNRNPIVRTDVMNLEEGIYIAEKSFGQITLMKKGVNTVDNKEQYTYTGKLHKGELAFVKGADLKKIIPDYVGENHGFTLEGEAKNIFDVVDGLNVYNAIEKRIFCYTTEKAKLVFTGDPEKNYSIYVTFYENCVGEENDRWAVIYAEEAKEEPAPAETPAAE